MEHPVKRSIFAVVLGCAVTAPLPAQDTWPPAKQKESEFTGRKVDAFQHGSKKEWGYGKPQRDSFLVLHPTKPRTNAPLYVVLHSAGHDVHSCLACTKTVGNHDIYHAPPDFLPYISIARRTRETGGGASTSIPAPKSARPRNA
jgi:hypothetical protein